MKQRTLLLQLVVLIVITFMISCASPYATTKNYTGNETRAEKPCKKKVVFGPTGRRHRGNYGLNY